MRLLAMLSKVDYGGGLWEHTGGPTSMAHCVLALHILFSNGKRSWQAKLASETRRALMLRVRLATF